MSQILRIAGRWTMTTFKNKDKHTICESCFFLRNGYRELSTQAKFDPNLKFFRKIKKKKLQNKKELHQQLVDLLDATLHQPSTSIRRNRYLESEVPQTTEFYRLNKDSLRLAKQTTVCQKATDGNLPSECDSKTSSDLLSKSVGNEQTLNEKYSSVIPSKDDTNQENKLDSVIIQNKFHNVLAKSQTKDTSQKYHNKKYENLKPDQNVAKSGTKDLKIVSKKKRKKAEIHEVYGRKSKKIHEQKEKLKKENKNRKENNVIFKKNIYEKSMASCNLNTTVFNEGLKETKALFKYEPDLDDLCPPKTLFSFSDENIQKMEDIEPTLMYGEESCEDVLDDVEEDVEHWNKLKDRLPDAEWAVIKAIRNKKKVSPKALTVEEWDKLEMLQDVFHEDTTIDQDIQYDHIISDWAPDVKHIEGMLTKKAKKILKEKQNKEKWKLLKVNEDLIQHTKQEIFNQDLFSYVEACVSVGITDRAFEDIKMYRAKNEEEYKITNVGIYNLVLRGLGKEEKGVHKVREVFSFIREDGLSPDLETYMICLSCLDSASDYDTMMASFIVKDIINEGLDVKDIFNKCTFLYNERSKVYQILTKVIPDFEPNPPVVDVMYNGNLVEPLNEMLPNKEKVEINPFTCGMSKQEIMEAAEEQFGRELDGITTVKSIFKTNTMIDTRKKESIDKIQENWKKDIKEAFIKRKSKLKIKAFRTKGINIYPFMCLFPEDDYVKILCEELRWWLLFSNMYSPSCAYLRKFLINRIRQRFSIQQMIEMDVFPKLYKTYSSYISHLINPDEQVKTQRELWKQLIQDISDGNSMKRPYVEWSESVRLTIGDIFFDLIVHNTKFDMNIMSNKPKKMVDAFLLVERSRDGKRNLEVKPHPAITNLVDAQADLIMPSDTLPSLCPPVPFLAPMQGGNFLSTVDLVRWCTDQQIEILKEKTEEAGPVLDSINVLSTYAWNVNKPVLDVVLKVFKEGGDSDLEIPIFPENIPRPTKLDSSASSEEKIEYNKQMFTYKKTVSEAVSQWWSSLYKLSIANQLRDRTFWLVMNLDFRGRTYPVAPHLHHQNQDFVKALLIFAKGKPLGEKGFEWLKLHLVNLTEHKKRATFEERLLYADQMIPNILDSADNPLTGNKWWMTSENPWQTLAACKEVAQAIRSGDPSMYVSHYPVHQDGSCNGLQHYAALGRDITGAKSVNLKQDGDTPADIYSDVVDLVRKEIEYDIANKTADCKIAKICQPYLERKVIKQSIMTTVYGVTMYGAKLQIQRQLGYKEFPNEHILVGSRYLAEKTFKCLNNLFTSARHIQEWFDDCSLAISKAGYAVEWKTPLNLLCIQPYYKSRLQPPDMPDKIYNYLIRKTHSLRVADIHKQKNGFAPNFIHSLDSTHMMLTSLNCYRKGLTYASVHDSFWTHPCDVDIMNKVTREQFIALHNQPILPNLSNHFIDRYLHRGDLNVDQHANLLKIFTNVPKTGEFDLNEIQQSQYFFS